MRRNWVLHPPGDEAHRLATALKINPLIAGLLLRRGLSDHGEIDRFLNPSFEHLQDPFVFVDMAKAVERIRQAIRQKEKILVYGDYDVDGITGSAILYPVLKKLGADVEVHIPHRMNDGYGLNRDSLEKLLRQKFTLVITVDNGITGADEVRYLNEKGADVIIVDHHTPKEEVPPAFAIVSSVAGGKGDNNLAACGLAFKVAWALLGSLEQALEYLDLVAVGTVADLAPVLGDNRIILKLGLPLLAKTKRPGLRALMEVAKIEKHFVSYRDIAFGLGPRINASGRMGSPLAAFKLLTTENPLEARNLAQILDQGNRDRQRVEADAFEEAIGQVEMDPGKEEQKIIVLENAAWHEGVLGIIAARLVERYRKPAIVISLKGNVGKGSGRSIPSFSIYDAMLPHETLMVNFGGHAQACGLTIQKENIQALRQSLNRADYKMGDLSEGVDLAVDGQMLAADIGAPFLKALGQMTPFGPGNPKPLFVSKNMKVRGEVRKRGKDTLQCWMTDQAGKITLEVIGFRSYGRWMSDGQEKSAVDIVYQPALKTFNGITSIQLELEDWRSG